MVQTAQKCPPKLLPVFNGSPHLLENKTLYLSFWNTQCFLPSTFSLEFLLLFNFGGSILQAKQLPLWGRGAPCRLMVYSLLNVSCLILSYHWITLPKQIFPAFIMRMGSLPRNHSPQLRSTWPFPSRLSTPPFWAIKRAFRLNICRTISESQTQNLCSVWSLISMQGSGLKYHGVGLGGDPVIIGSVFSLYYPIR